MIPPYGVESVTNGEWYLGRSSTRLRQQVWYSLVVGKTKTKTKKYCKTETKLKLKNNWKTKTKTKKIKTKIILIQECYVVLLFHLSLINLLSLFLCCLYVSVLPFLLVLCHDDFSVSYSAVVFCVVLFIFTIVVMNNCRFLDAFLSYFLFLLLRCVFCILYFLPLCYLFFATDPAVYQDYLWVCGMHDTTGYAASKPQV